MSRHLYPQNQASLVVLQAVLSLCVAVVLAFGQAFIRLAGILLVESPQAPRPSHWSAPTTELKALLQGSATNYGEFSCTASNSWLSPASLGLLNDCRNFDQQPAASGANSEFHKCSSSPLSELSFSPHFYRRYFLFSSISIVLYSQSLCSILRHSPPSDCSRALSQLLNQIHLRSRQSKLVDPHHFSFSLALSSLARYWPFIKMGALYYLMHPSQLRSIIQW